MENKNIATDVWNEYQKGVDYNYRQNLYEKSDKNYKFYLGNQWENAKLGGIQPRTKWLILAAKRRDWNMRFLPTRIFIYMT